MKECRLIQRIFDIFFSALGLLFLSPVLVLIIIVLRVTGEGEIFFLQNRVGKHGRCFGVMKFATMLKDSPNIGTRTITLADDPRILPFGAFLRKTKINELPQLINVLKGDMSLIGPRPLTEENFAAYSIDVQNKVTSVRPGVSGVASVIFRNEETLLTDKAIAIETYRDSIAPYKGALELWYVENNSPVLYFKLIFATIHVVIVPSSTIIWRLLPNLPKPPKDFHDKLYYANS